MSKKSDGQSKKSSSKAKYTSKGQRRSSICTHDVHHSRFINMRALKHVAPNGDTRKQMQAFFGPAKYDVGFDMKEKKLTFTLR